MNRTILIFSLLLFSACDRNERPAENEVRIVRDGYGVPHVYAETMFGVYYGYGYAIAQDRLFQMEMSRRSTQGTVAEVLGADYVDYDRNARTLFSPDSIRRQLDSLRSEDRDIFDGYAAGMNAWIASVRETPDTLLPKQFADLDFMPNDWTAYDVAMIFIGTMNNRYGDYSSELENAAILASLVAQHGEQDGRALFDLINPRFTDDAPTTIPREDWSRPAYDALAPGSANSESGAQTVAGPDAVLASRDRPPAGFSNVYLLGREKVQGGGSILVNGPQFGWFTPAYVYSIGLHGAGIDIVGNTAFGYPMIMFGHNETIAWGSTWGASDIVDIYAEQLNPQDPGQYRYLGEFVDFERRIERIAVKGSDPVEHEILRSVHGPIIQREAGIAYAKKRAWDGGELDNLLAWIRSTWASDWESWKAEAEKSSINVNMYFADVDGNIGYFHGGHFPRRVAGHDNRFPVTGDGSMEWQERQPVDTANPHVINPQGGFLANWNNKPGHGVMNPEFFFYSWSEADRVDFLHDALRSQDAFTPDEAWAILDTSSHADVYARYFVPAIDDALRESGDPALVEANRLLQSWNRQSRDDDGDGYYDERATGIFRYFIAALIERVWADDLGDVFPYFVASGYPAAGEPTGAGTNLPAAVKAIVEVMNGHAAYDPFNGVAINEVVASAMRDALAELGDEPLPVARRPFSVRNFLGIPQAGEGEAMDLPLEQNRGTENNMIVLRPGRIEGWEVTPPGQSGFVARDGRRSPHYDDQLDMYYRFGKKRTWFYPSDVEANKQSETVLQY